MKLYNKTYRKNFALILLAGYFLFLTAGVFHHHHTVISFASVNSFTEEQSNNSKQNLNAGHLDCHFCYTSSTHFALFTSVQNSEIEIVKSEYISENDFANITQLYYLSLSLRAPPFLA